MKLHIQKDFQNIKTLILQTKKTNDHTPKNFQKLLKGSYLSLHSKMNSY